MRTADTTVVKIHKRRALGVIFSIMLVDIIGLSILFPVAPYIVRLYSDQALMVTMVSAIYAAAQFFAAPALGKMGDHFGRRPVLLVSLFGSAVGYFIFGVGGALWILFLARLIDGITGGNLSTASAYIADISRPEERARNFTLVGMAWGGGLILGPALGGAAGQISIAAPAFLAAGLSLLNVVLSYFLLPESLSQKQRETAPLRPRDFNPLAAISDMVQRPGLGWLLLVQCLFLLAFNGINSIASLFVIRKFSAQPWQVGILMVLTGSAVAFVQFVMVRRLAPRYGVKILAIGSLAGQALGALGIFFAPTFWLVLLVSFFASASGGFIWSSMTTLQTATVSHRELGVLMGVTTALGSLMAIIGPVWGGLAFDHVMVGAPYWIATPIFLSAIIILAVRAVDVRPHLEQTSSVQ